MNLTNQENKMKAYRASATGYGVTAATPRQAAIKFFETFPTKRKCSVIEGEADGHFFTVAYGASRFGKWPSQWKDISRKLVDTLPDGE